MMKILLILGLCSLLVSSVVAKARVTRLVMVDENGREVHVFKRGINDDFSERDTVCFDKVGTRKLSIKADVEGSGFEYVNFKFNGKMYPDYDAPYAMQDNEGSNFNPVAYLATASDQRSIRVEIIDGNWQVISDIKLRFILADTCGGGPTPVPPPVSPPSRPPVPAPVAAPVPAPVAAPVPAPVPVSGANIKLFLVEAGRSGKVLHVIRNGDVVDLADFKAQELTAVAEVDRDVSHVIFKYNGGERKEGVKPYAVNGDSGGNYHNSPYLTSTGSKKIVVEAYDGRIVGKYEVNFMVKKSTAPVPAPVDPPVASPVAAPSSTKLVLYKAGQRASAIEVLKDGDVVDMAAYGLDLTVVADVDSRVSRVKFYFGGKEVTENVAPYVMNGNNGDRYHPAPYLASSGGKTVRAEIYHYDEKVETISVSFTLTKSSAPVAAPVMAPTKPPVRPSPPSPPTGGVATVTKFKMVDVNGRHLHTFLRGIDNDFSVRDTIKFSDIGTNEVTIVAEVSGNVDHIRFRFNGKVYPDFVAPFAMQGDENGRFFSVPYLSRPSRDLSIRALLYDQNQKQIGSTKLRFIME